MLARRGPFKRFTGAATFPVAPTQAETTSWQAAVVTNGGTVSAGRFAVVNNFIYAEKQLGLWALTDDYWGLWGENTGQALTSLKQLRLSTVTAAPTFTANRGYTFNGTTNYVDTGFIPATHAVAMTATSARIAAYQGSDDDAGGYTAGVNSFSNKTIRVRSRLAFAMSGEANYVTGNWTLVAVTSLGYSALSRNGLDATTAFGYKNGTLLTRTTDPTGFGATLPTHSIYIGGQNNGGAYGAGRACAVGLLCVGASLTTPQELAQYNNVQAWATAIGANV